MYKGKWRSSAALGCCAALLCGCHTAEAPSPPPAAADNTVRGVWLSYIELDAMLADRTPQQAADAIDDVMDTCAKNGLNTVFFHVRAHADAYFPSAVWRHAASAQAVLADGFDPLAYAVTAAHQRGLALHAWVNPYRIGSAPADGAGFEKNGVWYYAPDDTAARRAILEGVREILARYAVDGIHFDDYFYPAGMNPAGEPFESIPRGTDVTAWRQAQVDALVSGIYGLCHQSGRLFGVSPAADITKNRTVYYADVARWMADAGYIDYICPQLYVGFRHQSKPFLSLLDEWRALPRREGVKLYVGLALYKVGLDRDPYAGSGATEWADDETIIPRQIDISQRSADGYVLFRYGNLT